MQCRKLVIPAQAGIQNVARRILHPRALDSRLRGNERRWLKKLKPVPLVPAKAGTQE